MDKIVLEVDNLLAKAWREASLEKRTEINNKVSVHIGKELFAYSKEDFLKYLDELRSKMAERGLTEEALEEILNEAE